MAADEVEVEVGGRLVRVTNPGRVYFPARRETKLDLVRYYLSVGDGIVRALRERPCMMHRFPSGVAGDKVHQKRVPHAPRGGSTPEPRPAGPGRSEQSASVARARTNGMVLDPAAGQHAPGLAGVAAP